MKDFSNFINENNSMTFKECNALEDYMNIDFRKSGVISFQEFTFT